MSTLSGWDAPLSLEGMGIIFGSQLGALDQGVERGFLYRAVGDPGELTASSVHSGTAVLPVVPMRGLFPCGVQLCEVAASPSVPKSVSHMGLGPSGNPSEARCPSESGKPSGPEGVLSEVISRVSRRLLQSPRVGLLLPL